MKPGEGLTNKIMGSYCKFSPSWSIERRITRFSPFTDSVASGVNVYLVKDFAEIHLDNDNLCNRIADAAREQ